MHWRIFLLLLFALQVSGCVVLPVPADERVVSGREFSESDLSQVKLGETTKQEVAAFFGEPTIWLKEQEAAVYGVVRTNPYATLFLVGGGYSAGGAYWESANREAVIFLFDHEDRVKHWGQRKLDLGQTWLSGCLAWAESENIHLPIPPAIFTEELPAAGESLVYFYRPRDIQHYFPFMPPLEKILFEGTFPNVVNVGTTQELATQLHWKTYAPIRMPPGEYHFVFYPIEDNNLGLRYLSDTMTIDLKPAQTYFVDIRIEAGKGSMGVVSTQASREEALSVLKELKGAW